MKPLLTLCLVALMQCSQAQTTNPAPFCPHEYDGGTAPLTHYISSFTFGSFTNVSGPVQQPFPHYIFYNNLNPGPFAQNQTYPFAMEIDTNGVSRNIYLYADWSRDFVMSANELVYSSTVAGNVSTVNGSIPIPVLAGSAPVRLRVILEEDMSGASHGACATTVDWGETEDYELMFSPGTGIDQHQFEGVSIYPNPFIQSFQINTVLPVKLVRIYDHTMRTLFQENQGGATTAMFSLPDLHTGSYIVSVILEDGSEFIRHLVKTE